MAGIDLGSVLSISDIFQFIVNSVLTFTPPAL
jgi:hypothetical protein